MELREHPKRVIASNSVVAMEHQIEKGGKMSKIYCFGVEGGFMGSDGLRTICLQILVTESDRQTY